MGGVCIVFINQSDDVLTNQNNFKVRPGCAGVVGCKQEVFEMASRSSTRGSSTRRKNVDCKNTQSSNKDTHYGKRDVEASNIDVQQSIPSSGSSMNDVEPVVEQCTPAFTEALAPVVQRLDKCYPVDKC